MTEAKIDPELVYQNSEKLLNQLARLTQAVLNSWDVQPPDVRVHVGNATALIVRLQKYEAPVHDTAPKAPQRPQQAAPRLSAPPVAEDDGPAPPLFTGPPRGQKSTIQLKQEKARIGGKPERPRGPPSPFLNAEG